MVRKKLGRGRKNRCRFCTKEGCPRPAFVDYKDVQGLKKMCTSQGKLFSRKRSGNCAAFQRAVKDAVKRARFMAHQPGCVSISLHRSLDGRRIVNYIEWKNRDLLQSAHRAPEFRKEWNRFDRLTDEIEPHLYEVAEVIDGEG